jgi:guanyl-specific ribonuclease Sa
MNPRYSVRGLVVALGFLVAWAFTSPAPVLAQAPDPGKSQSPAPRHEKRVPDKVVRVLRYVDEHRRAPEGYEGGRTFRNLGRDGEESLPRTDKRGRSISYREWDVNRHMPGVNRGAERLVTGSDGSAYFTADHYRTFTKIR